MRNPICGLLRSSVMLIPALASMFAVAAEPIVPKVTAPARPVAASVDDKLELYACCYGRSPFVETYAFSDGRKDTSIEIAWSFFVARSGTQITLIDTGFSDAAQSKQWKLNSERQPIQLLAALHIDPAKVNRVIITHIHFDHLNNLPLFPQAEVVISRRDRDTYLEKKPMGGVIYDQRVADILADPARTHVIDQQETIPGGFDVEVVGGHTAGSAVVHLRHQGTHYVLAGDECYLCANQKEQRPIGVTVNRKRNTEFLSRIGDPAIAVLPCHDPAIFTSYPTVAPGVARIFGPQK